MKVPTGERKEIDSPLTTQTTQTDASTSLEEDTLMTPPPMPSRLGRIIFSSQSSSTDGSYDTTDGENESKASTHHRHLNLRPTANRSKPIEQSQNHETPPQQQALIDALQKLQKLATLDSTEYQQRLLENTLPSLQQIENTNTSLYCPSLADKSSSLTQELSHSIQTPLVQLSMSIHRLHSVVANITREIDGHTDEVQELQSQVSKLRRRNQKLEMAAKKVHTRNLQLEKQAKLDRRMVGGLQHKVQEYEAQLESQGLQLMANKVQNHEIQLQLSKNRARVDSNMSDFLDMGGEDGDSHLDDCQRSIQTSTTANSTMNEAHSPSRPNLASRSFDTATDSSSMAVIRFSKDGPAITPDRATTKSTKSTTVPSTSKDSEREPSTQQEELSDAKTNEGSFANRFTRFLGPRAVQNYSLKIVPPCNIQFVEIPIQGTGTNDESTALVVCGLQSFNEDINMKPTIGAQIIKINGNPVDERCTLQELYSELDKLKTKKSIILKFRNERWDLEQTKLLNAAIRDVGASRDNKEKANGASLFADTSQTVSDGAMLNEEGETDFGPPRARTGSSDSVGKVMDGIGNFLHNLQHPEGGTTQ